MSQRPDFLAATGFTPPHDSQDPSSATKSSDSAGAVHARLERRITRHVESRMDGNAVRRSSGSIPERTRALSTVLRIRGNSGEPTSSGAKALGVTGSKDQGVGNNAQDVSSESHALEDEEMQQVMFSLDSDDFVSNEEDVLTLAKAIHIQRMRKKRSAKKKRQKNQNRTLST